jgi:hypothetical protein
MPQKDAADKSHKEAEVPGAGPDDERLTSPENIRHSMVCHLLFPLTLK